MNYNERQDEKLTELSKLKQYTKEEILYGLQNSYYVSIKILNDVSYHIERKRIEEQYEYESQKLKDSGLAWGNYFAFIKRMKEKYGDDFLQKLSKEELDEGIKLEKKLKIISNKNISYQ